MSDWRVKYGNRHPKQGWQSAKKAASSWDILRPLLVAAPDSSKYLPVILVPELQHLASRSAKRRHIFMIGYALLWSALLALTYLFLDVSKVGDLLLITFITALYLLGEYKNIFLREDGLKKRSIYVCWVYEAGRRAALASIIIMLAAGLIQAISHRYEHSLDGVIYAWGFYYDGFSAGSAWRLLTGPFIHSGLTHWITNTCMLLLIAPVSWATSPRRTISIFLVGNIIAALSAMSVANLGWSDNDALVGVSGGIFSLTGYIFGHALRHKDSEPEGLWLSLLLFLSYSLLLAPIMAPNTSNTAHTAGFLTGTILALILPKIKSGFGQYAETLDTATDRN